MVPPKELYEHESMHQVGDNHAGKDIAMGPPSNEGGSSFEAASPPTIIDARGIAERPKKQSKTSPAGFQPRDRHRRASTRQWQKQKQRELDLLAAQNETEALNKELHRQHVEILNEVMKAKTALMDHAKCEHPAINSWLGAQARNFVLGGVRGSRPWEEGGLTATADEAHQRVSTRLDGAACG